MRRLSIIAIALIVLAGRTDAQQQVNPPLAEVARQSEAAKAQVKKARKSYTNADLTVDSRGERAAAPPPSEGFVSKSTGQAVTAEEMLTRSEDKAATEAVQQESEENWRARAASLRLQVERLQTRMTALTKPNPARDLNPASTARNAIEVSNVQSGLDGLRKSWTALATSARELKVPAQWIEPSPLFQ